MKETYMLKTNKGLERIQNQRKFSGRFTTLQKPTKIMVRALEKRPKYLVYCVVLSLSIPLLFYFLLLDTNFLLLPFFSPLLQSSSLGISLLPPQPYSLHSSSGSPFFSIFLFKVPHSAFPFSPGSFLFSTSPFLAPPPLLYTFLLAASSFLLLSSQLLPTLSSFLLIDPSSLFLSSLLLPLLSSFLPTVTSFHLLLTHPFFS